MSIKCVIRDAGGFMKGKEAYYPDVINAVPISEQQFVTLVVNNRNIEEGHLRAALAAVSTTLLEFLSLGHSVTIGGLGTFSVDVKGKIEADKNGVLQLKDGAYKCVRFNASSRLEHKLKSLRFSLDSHRVFAPQEFNEQTAYAAAMKLLSDKKCFVSCEFEEEVGASRSLAKKMLNALQEKGTIQNNGHGRYKIWSKVGE